MNEPILDLENMQGISFPGFRKANHHFLFFSIGDTERATHSLALLIDKVSSSQATLDEHEKWKVAKNNKVDLPEPLFYSLSFSAQGLRQFIGNDEVDAFKDKAFKIGMSKRSSLIGDPSSSLKPGHRSKWLFGGDQPVEVLLSIASDSGQKIQDEIDTILPSLQGMTLVHHDKGTHKKDAPGHEQFGFSDGISQPALRGMRSDREQEFVTPRKWPEDTRFDELRKDFASPGRTLIWPGHIFFGYKRQSYLDPRTQGEQEALGPEWAANGSFFVYRRLQQDVEGFENFIQEQASEINIDEEKLGAMLVGRWKSGAPISRSPNSDTHIGGDASNYFAFSGLDLPPLPNDDHAPAPDDTKGMVCPFGSHIRKVNPRDDFTDIGPPTRTPPKLILRRGITYDKGNDKGLLFVAFMSSIADQFEFIMKEWVKGSEQPKAGAGHDPLLAIGDGKYTNIYIDGTKHKVPLPGNLVLPTGGEYFFNPSIAFLKQTFSLE